MVRAVKKRDKNGQLYGRLQAVSKVRTDSSCSLRVRIARSTQPFAKTVHCT